MLTGGLAIENYMEIWKSIKEYEGFYEVSNLGRIRSLFGGKAFIMKLSEDKDNYLIIILAKQGNKKTKKVHRLVLETFIGECPKGYQTGHLDGNKQNNILSNLKWITPKENAYHKILHGTTATGFKNGAYTHPEKIRKGDQVNTSKLTEEQVIFIRKNAKKGNYSYIGRLFGVSHTAIRLIITGKNWKHLPKKG